MRFLTASSSPTGVAWALSVGPLISSWVLELVIVISVPIAAPEVVAASASEITTPEVVVPGVGGALAFGPNGGKR